MQTVRLGQNFLKMTASQLESQTRKHPNQLNKLACSTVQQYLSMVRMIFAWTTVQQTTQHRWYHNQSNMMLPNRHQFKVCCRRVGAPSEKTIRPNFFFALQVSQSKAVVAAIKSVHSSLLQHSAGPQAALVEPETAHLTILVTAQQAQDDVQRAEAAMESLAADTALDSTLAQPLTLTLEGLSHFRH